MIELLRVIVTIKIVLKEGERGKKGYDNPSFEQGLIVIILEANGPSDIIVIFLFLFI